MRCESHDPIHISLPTSVDGSILRSGLVRDEHGRTTHHLTGLAERSTLRARLSALAAAIAHGLERYPQILETWIEEDPAMFAISKESS
jgi:hypothetical protein